MERRIFVKLLIFYLLSLIITIEDFEYKGIVMMILLTVPLFYLVYKNLIIKNVLIIISVILLGIIVGTYSQYRSDNQIYEENIKNGRLS